MPATPCLVWLRNDLRVQDNPALAAAAATGQSVLCVYILDDDAAGPWALGGASRWWLHEALRSFKAPLILRRGDSGEVLRSLARETGATQIYWNRRYEPWATAQDAAIETALRGQGIDVRTSNGRLLCEPGEVLKKDGTPYKVFTPYWQACLKFLHAHPPADPLPAPKLSAPASLPASDKLDDWHLHPTKPDWAKEIAATWTPGEKAGQQILAAFAMGKAAAYAGDRNTPGLNGTSRLSPYLAFGHLSPRQIWHALHDNRAADAYVRQIFWREFSAYLLFHFPQTATEPLNAKYAAFPWRDDARDLVAWQHGMTGYPLVDAGQRQLWRTGWQHNRVRLVVSSFLVKHLLLSWQSGSAWFWDTLVDADLANNSMGWQWIAGSGADASPYFRIFNPVTQSEKFDPGGEYIRAFVPELARLPNKYIHAPWLAPAHILAKAGVTLGKNYPKPIVDHDAGRQRALGALRQMRSVPAEMQETKRDDQTADQ